MLCTDKCTMAKHDNSIDSVIYSKYDYLKCCLSQLGYDFEFPIEVIPLLEHLVADILQTTDTLLQYKELSQSYRQACLDLEELISVIAKGDKEHAVYNIFEHFPKDIENESFGKIPENSYKNDDKDYLLKKVKESSIIERDLKEQILKLNSENVIGKEQILELQNKLREKENECKELSSEMTKIHKQNTSNKKQVELLENELKNKSDEDVHLKSEVARLNSINIVYKNHILELEKLTDSITNKKKPNLNSKLDLQINKKVLHPRNISKQKLQSKSSHECEYCKLTEKMIIEYKDKMEMFEVEKKELIENSRKLQEDIKCYKQHVEHSESELQKQKSENSELLKSLSKSMDSNNQMSEYISKKHLNEEILQQKQCLPHKCDHCKQIEKQIVEYRNMLQSEKNEFHRKEAEYRKIIVSNEQNLFQLRTELKAMEMDLHHQKNENNKLVKVQDEARELRDQIHEYIAKVQAAQEMLEIKDRERSELLDYFRVMTLETAQLQDNKNTLENEAHSVRSRLRVAETKLTDLEHTLKSKDDLIVGYEQQLNELTKEIAALETQISQLKSERDELKSDLRVKILQEPLYDEL